jgi:hypothetical protein
MVRDPRNSVVAMMILMILVIGFSPEAAQRPEIVYPGGFPEPS